MTNSDSRSPRSHGLGSHNPRHKTPIAVLPIVPPSRIYEQLNETNPRRRYLLSASHPVHLQDINLYFVGRYRHKLHSDYTSSSNCGFDDESHNAPFIVGDHLAYRFEIVKLFGAAAFGQVVRCFDDKSRSEVAVNVIVNTAQMHEQ
jgi:hypothetical protein